MDQTELVFTSDKKRLEKFFHSDPVLFSYHLGDLDDFYFDDCQWAVRYGTKPVIEDCILVYHGLTVPTVLAFGITDDFKYLLNELIPILPRQFYSHYKSESQPLFTQRFSYTDLGRHQKMKLENRSAHENFLSDDIGLIRLDLSHEQALRELYEKAYPGNYFDTRMLRSGKYFGYLDESRIIAVAGVHVDSDEYGIAVLGNITTDPDRRGEGLATRLTARLVAELTGEGKMICLNVKTDNSQAIHCYEKLGFVRVCQYREAFFQQA